MKLMTESYVVVDSRFKVVIAIGYWNLIILCSFVKCSNMKHNVSLN